MCEFIETRPRHGRFEHSKCAWGVVGEISCHGCLKSRTNSPAVNDFHVSTSMWVEPIQGDRANPRTRRRSMLDLMTDSRAPLFDHRRTMAGLPISAPRSDARQRVCTRRLFRPVKAYASTAASDRIARSAPCSSAATALLAAGAEGGDDAMITQSGSEGVIQPSAASGIYAEARQCPAWPQAADRSRMFPECLVLRSPHRPRQSKP